MSTGELPPGFVRVRWGYEDPPERPGHLRAVEWQAGVELPAAGDYVVIPGSQAGMVRLALVNCRRYVFEESDDGLFRLTGVEVDATS